MLIPQLVLQKKEETKTTRFAAGTKGESSKAKKPVLARDHSLGREYITAGESVSLEGFSWQDPFQNDSSKRNASYGTPAAPAPVTPGVYPPAGRHSSSGSLGIAPPHHGGPPPPPDYYGRVGSDRTREYSNGRYDSWSSPFPYPPPPPPPAVHGPTHQRSGSWTNCPPPPPPQVPNHQRSGSWSGRDHSLAFNPLIGASIAHPADRRAFENRAASGYWAGPYRSPPRHTSPTNSTPSPKPSYNVDMDIARTWSGGAEGGNRSWQMDQDKQRPLPYFDGQPAPVKGADSSPMRNGIMPRPQMVKRDTSHQNENVETKHQVKRAALNRDNSLASNRLKQEYMPEFYNNKFNSEQEVKKLSDNLEQSTLGSGLRDGAKPEALKDSNRVSTLDIITSDLMAKPEPLSSENRVSTIDALGIELGVEPVMEQEIKLEDPSGSTPNDTKGEISKPKAMTLNSRITTNEFFEIVNATVDAGDPLDLDKADDGPPPLDQEEIAGTWLAQS